MMSAQSDASVQAVLAVIHIEETHRETLMRALLDLTARGQETAEVFSALKQTEDNLAALREGQVHLEMRGRDR